MIIGSRARADHPADAWSDLDTIAIVDDAAVYTQDGAWKTALLAALDHPLWFAAFSHTGRGDPEWEFVFAEGLKLDIVFFTNRAPQGAEASLTEMVAHTPYRGVFERGVRILVDKDPQARPFVPPQPAPRPLPDQAAFDNVSANVLLDLTRAVKLARRGELWRAARAINDSVQSDLLTLIEWHANPAPVERAWTYGRFLEEWADPRVLAALPAVYAAGTFPSIRRAVGAALDLLAWLGPETAHRLNLAYPAASVDQTAPWLRKTLEQGQ